ncbi:MAG: glycosyltransferase family 2 protein [Pseudomonadota bacterium]
MSGAGRGLSFSVAVLNHRRPTLLKRVLTAVSQLDHSNFEVVVVGDQPSLDSYALPDWLVDQVKYVSFPDANICRSRNLAVEASAGDIIAFIDDDAVPEPDWLRRLSRAFRFGVVGGVGGLVRKDDGVRIEWAGGLFNRAAVEAPLLVRDEVRVFDADSQMYGDQFIGTMGANSAFRRKALLSVGGFDESIKYYLDETDIMLRLAEAGWDAAFVRSAEVHHLREANAVRDSLRTPRNLFQIAASKAYFCRRHLPGDQVADELMRFRDEKIWELDPYIRLGLIRRREREQLRRQINDGITDGMARSATLPLDADLAPTRLQRFQAPVPSVSVAICSGWGVSDQLRAASLARRLASCGARVSFIGFRSGHKRLSVSFEDGVWWHRGGTWRLDQRHEGRWVIGRAGRARAEIARAAARRRFDIVLTCYPELTAEPISLPQHTGPLYARAAPGTKLPLEKAVDRLLDAAKLTRRPTHVSQTADLQPAENQVSTVPG